MIGVAFLFLAAPEPPRVLMDTRYSPSACTTTVASGGNVQTAINSAACGDTVCLEAGATFTGNFTLPDKDCTDTTWVTIRTATTDANFPKPGTRVAPGNAALMSKLAAGSGSIVSSDSDADHYRFVGIEFAPSAFLTQVITLEGGIGSLATQTNHIIFDRCYIHGHATLGSRRGISAQGAYIAVIDSYLSDFKEVGADSQAFAAWNGSGPFKLVNNYLEGAGENVIFGGADSSSAELVPSDIEIRRNYFYKPLTWRVGDPSYEGTHWSVKNLFELKSARRVVIENNRFEQCWVDGQIGIAILFTVRNQSDTAPWSVVEDVLFRHNQVVSVARGVQLLGRDDTFTSEPEERISITDNLFLDVDQNTWGVSDSGYLFLANHGVTDLTIENNTAFIDRAATSILFLTGTPDSVGLVQRYNISSHQNNGVIGDGVGVGNPAFAEFAPDAVYTVNVMTDQPTYGSLYSNHPGNVFPADMAAVGFENLGGGDYRLDSASDYFGDGPGGRDLGVFFPAAGQSFLDLEVQAAGTSAVLRFGRPGLSATQSCTIRYGSSSTTSTSGGSRRTVVITGLTNAQQYAFSVDCGDVDGDIADSLFTAATPSVGDRTIPIQIGSPSTALAALGAARCTMDYDDNAGMSSPTSVQDTTCSSGGAADMTVPAGPQWYRWRWQTVSDTVIATGTPQPMVVP